MANQRRLEGLYAQAGRGGADPFDFLGAMASIIPQIMAMQQQRRGDEESRRRWEAQMAVERERLGMARGEHQQRTDPRKHALDLERAGLDVTQAGLDVESSRSKNLANQLALGAAQRGEARAMGPAPFGSGGTWEEWMAGQEATQTRTATLTAQEQLRAQMLANAPPIKLIGGTLEGEQALAGGVKYEDLLSELAKKKLESYGVGSSQGPFMSVPTNRDMMHQKTALFSAAMTLSDYVKVDPEATTEDLLTAAHDMLGGRPIFTSVKADGDLTTEQAEQEYNQKVLSLVREWRVDNGMAPELEAEMFATLGGLGTLSESSDVHLSHRDKTLKPLAGITQETAEGLSTLMGTFSSHVSTSVVDRVIAKAPFIAGSDDPDMQLIGRIIDHRTAGETLKGRDLDALMQTYKVGAGNKQAASQTWAMLSSGQELPFGDPIFEGAAKLAYGEVQGMFQDPAGYLGTARNLAIDQLWMNGIVLKDEVVVNEQGVMSIANPAKAMKVEDIIQDFIEDMKMESFTSTMAGIYHGITIRAEQNGVRGYMLRAIGKAGTGAAGVGRAIGGAVSDPMGAAKEILEGLR